MHAAGEKAQKKLLMGVQPLPLMQMAFDSFLHGQPLAEPTLERRPFAAPIPVAVAMPLPMAGGAAMPLGALNANVACKPVLACVVRAP